jgi:hypothetical protein
MGNQERRFPAFLWSALAPAHCLTMDLCLMLPSHPGDQLYLMTNSVLGTNSGRE